jgi:hypothetical protein
MAVLWADPMVHPMVALLVVQMADQTAVLWDGPKVAPMAVLWADPKVVPMAAL